MQTINQHYMSILIAAFEQFDLGGSNPAYQYIIEDDIQLIQFLHDVLMPTYDRNTLQVKQEIKRVLAYNLVRHSSPGDKTLENICAHIPMCVEIDDFPGFFRTVWNYLYSDEVPLVKDGEQYIEIDDFMSTLSKSGEPR